MVGGWGYLMVCGWLSYGWVGDMMDGQVLSILWAVCGYECLVVGVCLIMGGWVSYSGWVNVLL